MPKTYRPHQNRRGKRNPSPLFLPRKRSLAPILQFLARMVLSFMALLSLCSCQIGYMAHTAFHQAKLMGQRVPLQYALDHYDLSPQQRKRLEQTLSLRQFMKEELGLKTERHYSRYVHLTRPYVTYVVNAAPKNELKPYIWSFPLVGKVPYKGYFNEAKARQEALWLQEKNLDTHVRGVSAYSTLGWFEDPLLSSMLRGKEHRFVNTLIHETVHANLYIKGESKFNERVASFLGQLGTRAYYKRENRGEELKKIVSDESHDEFLFSQFITKSLKDLRQWYQSQKGLEVTDKREAQFKAIKEGFKKDYLPKMKTQNYSWFPKKKLNNAFLLLLELYNSDFSTLEKLAQHYNGDFPKVFKELKKLEDEKDPEKALKERVKRLESHPRI